MLTRQNIHHLCPKCLIFVLLSKSETQIILNKVFFTELSDVQTDGGHKKGLFLSLDFPFFFCLHRPICNYEPLVEFPLSVNLKSSGDFSTFGATSVEAARLANFSFSSAAWARRVWPSRVVQVLAVPGPLPVPPATAPPPYNLHCAPGSLAPNPPQSSSPAILAAIAKARAGIQLDAKAQ